MTDHIDALAMNLHITASYSDVKTIERRDELQEILSPLLVEYRAGRVDEAELYDAVNEFMGPDWKPGWPWSGQIRALGFTPGIPGK